MKGGKLNMSKLTAWLMTLVGVLWLLPLLTIEIGNVLTVWLIGLAFLGIGISQLTGN